MIRSRPLIAIIDYGIGNHSSLYRCMCRLGYSVCVTHSPSTLSAAHLLLLPGVGAFPSAMERLRHLDLVPYILDAASRGRPILGICLGMQILTQSSTEITLSSGLGLIPGAINAIPHRRFHIGWNTIQASHTNSCISSCNGLAMYFNHSYAYTGPDEYVLARTQITPTDPPLVAAIASNSVLGLQFHPEKSQAAGILLLQSLITQMIRSC